jgi:hypothetical protein
VAKDRAPGLKPKDLCEIPSDVVRALRADGWWLRCRIPWLKRNAMPESTRDRPASAVEYVFLLTKSAAYFYDGEAVRVSGAGVSGGACFGKQSGDPAETLAQQRQYERPEYHTRARRNSDWFFESWQGLYDEGEGPLAFIVNPAAFKGSHFATFPPRLVEPCIKPGTSEKGCCPKCGAPWRRVVGSQRIQTRNIVAPKSLSDDADRANVDPGRHIRASSTLGWSPTCSDYEAEWERWWQEWSATASRTRCARKRHQQDAVDRWTSRARASLRRGPLPYGEVAPCTVLDPFGGAGTVSLLANRLGRRSIYIDLSPKYVEMAAERLRKDSAPATHVSEQEGEAPLFAGQESGHD